MSETQRLFRENIKIVPLSSSFLRCTEWKYGGAGASHHGERASGKLQGRPWSLRSPPTAARARPLRVRHINSGFRRVCITMKAPRWVALWHPCSRCATRIVARFCLPARRIRFGFIFDIRASMSSKSLIWLTKKRMDYCFLCLPHFRCPSCQAAIHARHVFDGSGGFAPAARMEDIVANQRGGGESWTGLGVQTAPLDKHNITDQERCSRCTLCLVKPHVVRQGGLGAVLSFVQQGGFQVGGKRRQSVSCCSREERRGGAGK